MSNFAEVLAEDRRLVILRSLSEVTGFRLNEDVLKSALNHLGHDVGRDVIRADIQYLTDHGLARIGKLTMPSGELWLVTLTSAGGDVAHGRYHPGVAQLSPT
jgi:hypothetical protein